MGRDIVHTSVPFACHIFASFYFLDSFPTSWTTFCRLLDKLFGQWVVKLGLLVLGAGLISVTELLASEAVPGGAFKTLPFW